MNNRDLCVCMNNRDFHALACTHVGGGDIN